MVSGSWAGTVAANRPPGCNTRTIFGRADRSSWMCSRTSEVMTTSKQPSSNGSEVASPRNTPREPSGGISPAQHCSQCVLGLHNLFLGVVESDRSCTSTRAFIHVTTETSPDIEHAISGSQPKFIEPDRASTAVRFAEFRNVAGHVENFSVLVNGEFGAVPPRPALGDTLSASSPNCGTGSGWSRACRIDVASDDTSPAVHRKTASPSAPVTFW